MQASRYVMSICVYPLQHDVTYIFKINAWYIPRMCIFSLDCCYTFISSWWLYIPLLRTLALYFLHNVKATNFYSCIKKHLIINFFKINNIGPIGSILWSITHCMIKFSDKFSFTIVKTVFYLPNKMQNPFFMYFNAIFKKLYSRLLDTKYEDVVKLEPAH